MRDPIERKAVLDELNEVFHLATLGFSKDSIKWSLVEQIVNMAKKRIEQIRPAEMLGDSEIEAIKAALHAHDELPDKYEYHYDHTDCIWYRPEARNRCPVTCAQYRDGWNDAMNYIYRDGAGYRPFRRDERYERRQERKAFLIRENARRNRRGNERFN